MNFADLLTVRPGRPLRGELRVPGDKSISHRGLLFGALAEGRSTVRRPLLEGDCLATLGCLRALGVEIVVRQDEAGEMLLDILGHGPRGLLPPAGELDCNRSGTTMRLLSGILAGQGFPVTLIGHAQLLRRPMKRVVDPLRQMGARVSEQDGHAPLRFEPAELCGIDYALPMASAQVKSAVLLAGLLAQGATSVREPAPTRDHTERLLRAMGADLHTEGLLCRLHPGRPLAPFNLTVPGDISSAAFPLVAGALVPGSQVVIRQVGLNPTRTGVLDVLREMGAPVEILAQDEAGGEPVGDVRIRSAPLRGVEIAGALIPRLIDELPILAVAATQAVGRTVIRDAAELRVKESDRIESVVAALRRLGAAVEARPDGMIIEGPCRLHGAAVSSGTDHRLVMSLLVAGLIAEGETRVDGAGFIADSYPGFLESLAQLGAEVR